MLIEDIRDVGRDSASNIAMIVLWIESMVEWNAMYGDEVCGAKVWA